MPPQKNHHSLLELRHVPGYFLMFCIILSLYFLFQLLVPFATALIFSVVLAIAFYPLFRWLKKIFRERGGLASFVTVFVILLVIILPFLVLLSLLASEATSVYTFIDQKIRSGALDWILKWEPGGFFFDLRQRYLPGVELSDFDLKGQVAAAAKTVTDFLFTQSTKILGGIVTLILDFLILIISLYYFLKDGESLIQKIMDLSPLPNRYEKAILGKLGDMTNAVLYGTFLTAIVQGFLGGLGFFFVDIPQAVLWGTVMAFFSLLPYAGTAIIWFPAALLLFFTGHPGKGIFLFFWGMIAVGMSDNFLRPYFIGSKTETYPLLMFLSVMGGIFAFGLSGALFGPVIVTFVMTFLEIYRHEYSRILKEIDHD